MSLRESWIERVMAAGNSREYAELLWQYEQQEAAWRAYEQAQEAYALMHDEDQVPH